MGTGDHAAAALAIFAKRHRSLTALRAISDRRSGLSFLFLARTIA